MVAIRYGYAEPYVLARLATCARRYLGRLEDNRRDNDVRCGQKCKRSAPAHDGPKA